MGVLNEMNHKSTNTTAPQTPAEKLKVMRPTDEVPPRVIIHSLDLSAGKKQDKDSSRPQDNDD